MSIPTFDELSLKLQNEYKLPACHMEFLSEELADIHEILDCEDGRNQLLEFKERLSQQSQVSTPP